LRASSPPARLAPRVLSVLGVTNREAMAETAAVRRILLVDDEESVLFAMHEYFSLRGHEVHRASDAKAALRLLDETPFAWVVTDLHLTGAREASGLAIAHAARRAGAVRVVLLTAHRTPAVDHEAALAGIDSVVAKPVTLPELARVLETSDGGEA
jgi:CheY-like chemotaxis protein